VFPQCSLDSLGQAADSGCSRSRCSRQRAPRTRPQLGESRLVEALAQAKPALHKGIART
jgi:hypothetical protein